MGVSDRVACSWPERGPARGCSWRGGGLLVAWRRRDRGGAVAVAWRGGDGAWRCGGVVWSWLGFSA
jgi:hypothetical protein